MLKQGAAAGPGEQLLLFLGREAGEDEVPGRARLVDGDDDPVAGAGQPAGAVDDLGEHGVEVERRADAQDGRAQRGDALAQRLVLPPQAAGIGQGSLLAERHESRCDSCRFGASRNYSRSLTERIWTPLFPIRLFDARSATLQGSSTSLSGGRLEDADLRVASGRGGRGMTFAQPASQPASQPANRDFSEELGVRVLSQDEAGAPASRCRSTLPSSPASGGRRPFDEAPPASSARDPRRLAAALIFGTLCVFHAAPAAAQDHHHWSATLVTGGDGEQYIGCGNGIANFVNCSDSSVLSDDDFTYRGTTYTISALAYAPGSRRLWMRFDGITGSEAKKALGVLSLWRRNHHHNVEIKDAGVEGNALFWWSPPGQLRFVEEGEHVGLVLVGPHENAPDPPDLLSATASTDGRGNVVLRWNRTADNSITKYQVTWRGPSARHNKDWHDIPDSRAKTSHVVTGLTSGSEYAFRIRAVNAFGAGGPSNEKRATPTRPPNAPAKPDLLSAAGSTNGSGNVELLWNLVHDETITKFQVGVPQERERSRQVQHDLARHLPTAASAPAAGSAHRKTSHLVTGLEKEHGVQCSTSGR